MPDSVPIVAISSEGASDPVKTDESKPNDLLLEESFRKMKDWEWEQFENDLRAEFVCSCCLGGSLLPGGCRWNEKEKQRKEQERRMKQLKLKLKK